MNEQAILNVVNLGVRRGSRTILQQLTWSVASGELLALVGPNGAGKTTLLKCLAGLIAHTGEVALHGVSLSSLARRKLAQIVAYVPQSVDLSFPFSVREFVSFGRYPHLERFCGLQPEDERFVEALLEKVGIRSLADQRVSSLSGGERQKVLLASALAQQPKLLLLDEPTAYLDPKRQRDLMALLHTLCSDGLSVVAVTHDINGMGREADRILALKAGQQHFLGTPEEFIRPEILAGLYDERFTLFTHPESKRQVAITHSTH